MQLETGSKIVQMRSGGSHTCDELRGGGDDSSRKTSFPGVLGALIVYEVVLGHLAAAKLLYSCILPLSSAICGAILCLRLGVPEFKAPSTNPPAALPGCLGCRTGTISPMMWTRQFAMPGKAQGDVGSDTLKTYLLSIHHPDNMGGKNADTMSIKGLSAGRAFLCSSSSQQEAALDKTLSAALMAD